MNLQIFKTQSLFLAMQSFFKKLNLPVSEVTEDPANPEDIVSTYFNLENEAHTLIDVVYFLGMVNESAFAGEENTDSLTSIKASKEDYDGLLIFGIQLKNRANGLNPTRSQLAEITRLFNREYNYTPVTLIFKYGEQIAFANSERLKYKQEWREGEKVGKVSLLRDIDIEKPHTGHLKIIEELRIKDVDKQKINSFSKLYEYWQKVFNVSILNKQFYNEIQKWYFWAVQEVAFPHAPNRFDFDTDEKFDAALTEHKSKNVIRLLTRILFIWFIKEKKLIPEEIFDSRFVESHLLKDFTPQKPHGVFATGKQTSMYYRAILQNLFFATLNQEMGKRAYRKDKAHRNITNLMRYQTYFKEGADQVFVDLMEKIVPFMNGGLFECLDKPHPTEKGRQGGEVIIYEDGFSDRDDNTLQVPDFLFFDVDEDIDISNEMGSANRVYKQTKTRGLLEILQSYKFTIAENTPVEEDVALDPELLGRVFENLLASYNPETKTTARKQTGSFYTPREIVNYMVDESLIAYLKSALSFQLKEWSDDKSQSRDASGTFSQSKDASGTFSQSRDASETLPQNEDDFDELYTFFNPTTEIDIHEGNLPHWQQKNVWYFITFRLADSIPANKVEELKRDRELWNKRNKEKSKEQFTKEDWREYHRLFSERVEKWLNAGYGSCLLKKVENASIVANALKHFEGERYILDEWVIMPNHVHLLVKPIDDNNLSDILHSWKSYTANQINKSENRSGQLWMRESYDHIVRKESALKAFRHYIKMNPVKAGIVSKASSFGKVSKASSFGKVSEASSFGNIPQSKDASGGLPQSKDASGTLDTMLHQLLAFDDTGNPFKEHPEIQTQIIKALDSCKILDPACGSGAFPMGVLQKMVHILHKVDANNTEWKQRQIERVNNAIANLEEIEDPNFREKSIKELENQIKDIEEAFANNELDYGRKLYLIENCIYGVDIQSIAIQISKLRFFISLIVDQKIDPTKANFGVRPLPNLETKFVAANTLIGIEKPDTQLNLFENTEVKLLEDKLKAIRHKLFSSKSPSKKRELREQDKILRTQIAAHLVENGWGNQTARQLAEWDPYDQNASSPFFDPEWMFGISNGFDVVIGNPPYGVSIKGKDRTDVLKFQKKVPDFEIYYFFIGAAHSLVSNKGTLSYIIPNTYLFNVFAENYRNELISSWGIKTIIDFTNYALFDAATVRNSVIILCKGFETGLINYLSTSNSELNLNQFISQSHEILNVSLLNEFSQNWALAFKLPQNKINAIAKIKQNSKPLSFYFPEISQGLIAYDKYQGQSQEIIDARTYHYSSFKNGLKKWLWGEDVTKYRVNWNGKEYVDYCNGIANPRQPKFFNGKRMLIREITNPTIFAAITDEEMYNDPAILIVLNSDNCIEAATMILNSCIGTFFHFNASPKATKGDFPKILVKDIKEFPLPKSFDSINQHFISNLYQIVSFSVLLNNIVLSMYLIIDAVCLNLYFPDHMQERGIDVLQFVERDIKSACPKLPASGHTAINLPASGQIAFDTLSDEQKEAMITQLHSIWTDPNNEVVQRMAQFKEKSPDILKVILES